MIPLWKMGKIWGVLDLDSPLFGRFSEEDQRGLENAARAIEAFL